MKFTIFVSVIWGRVDNRPRSLLSTILELATLPMLAHGYLDDGKQSRLLRREMQECPRPGSEAKVREFPGSPVVRILSLPCSGQVRLGSLVGFSGSISGWVTKIPQVAWHAQKRKERKY